MSLWELIFDALWALFGAIEWGTIWDILTGVFLALWFTHQAPNPAGRQVVIRADGANGCHADLTVNGHVVRMLLDSGALGMPLVFGSNQLDALGIDKASLDFSHRYSSANGEGREAFVRLREITLSGWSMHDVPAVITKVAQEEGLFGSEYLHRLSFTTSGGYCTLTMPDEAARVNANTRDGRHIRPAS